MTIFWNRIFACFEPHSLMDPHYIRLSLQRPIVLQPTSVCFWMKNHLKQLPSQWSQAKSQMSWHILDNGIMVSYVQKVTYLGRMADNHPFEMLASSFCNPDNDLSPCTKYFSNKGVPDKTPSTISKLKSTWQLCPIPEIWQEWSARSLPKEWASAKPASTCQILLEILEDDLALVALYVHLQYNSGGRYGWEDVFKKNRMNPFLCRCLHFASILFGVLYLHQLILFFHFSCSRVWVWKVIEKVEDISGITANLKGLYFWYFCANK